jgi:hypothetical protein
MDNDPDKPSPIRCVDFTNGGVDIVCADSIDARADVNLNGEAYEIADAVLLSNYFVYGLSVFTVNVEGQIAASDVNADGLTLTVADLVYLIRVVVGDAVPIPRLSPGEHDIEVDLQVRGGMLSVKKSDFEIGGMYLVLEGNIQPALADPASAMELRYNFDGENTRVLIIDPKGKFALGEGEVLDIGSAAVVDVQLGSINGLNLKGRVQTLPDHLELAYNYPNPFNPTTTIAFALPEPADWSLTIFNVLGQTVEVFDGSSPAGPVSLQWDASPYASGVYFYRLQVGDMTKTRKMLLLK